MSQQPIVIPWKILAQVPLTLAILVWMPGNVARAVALLLLWAVTFGRITRGELIFAGIICVFFTGMNAAALKDGIFAFTEPDVLAQPYFELFMWGFYVLHTIRLLGPAAPDFQPRLILPLTALYSACFATLGGGMPLLVASGSLLLLGLARFHEPRDLLYTGYFILMGAAFEYTGVLSGLWTYPNPPAGGVPPWFITLWGGVGFLLHRLALPLLARYGVYSQKAPAQA